MRRRALIGSLVAGVVTVTLGGVAWACVAISRTPTFETSAQKVPVGTAVTLTAKAWDSTSPVAVGLSPDGSRMVHSLASVTPAADGAFTADVEIAGVSPGMTYLVLSQSNNRKAVPIEVLASTTADPAAATAAPGAASATDDLWGGFESAPVAVPGLEGLQEAPAGDSGSNVWALALIASLALVGGTALAFELRRRRVSMTD